MLRIRAHHLNCMPRFQGRGYSEKFCRNIQRIKELIENGAEYELVFSADDICECCPNLINGVCSSEEKVSRYDRLSAEGLDISEICYDCVWYDICKNT